MADENIGRPRLTPRFQTGAEFIPLRRRIERIEHLAQHVANKILVDLGAVFRPVGFHHPRFGSLDIDDKADFPPEILDLIPEFIRRLGNDQPALTPRTFDADFFHIRQHLARLCHGALTRILRKSRRAAPVFGNDVTIIARRRSQIRRNFKGRHLVR